MNVSFRDSSTILHRLQSSPGVHEVISPDYKGTHVTTRVDGLLKSVDFSQLPNADNIPHTVCQNECPLSRSDLAHAPLIQLHKTPAPILEISSASRELSNNEREKRLGRRKSLVSGPKAWIHQIKSSPEKQSIQPMKLERSDTIQIRERSNRVDSFASFARKSWLAPSRSPSPKHNLKRDTDISSLEDDSSTAASSVSSSSPRKTFVSPLLNKSSEPTTELTRSTSSSSLRRGVHFLSKAKRSKGVTLSKSDSKSTSVTNLSTSVELLESSGDVLPISKDSGRAKLGRLGVESASVRKDELATAFRTLEADYHKFQSKSAALRGNAIRSTLLPFLNLYVDHPSNNQLRIRDLEKRVGILNKWWTALLDLLDGPGGNHISGIDRPVFLDAIIGIMTRPEWRSWSTKPSAWRAQSPEISSARSTSSASLGSSASNLVAESIYHNINDSFVLNLQSQMRIVVDKMSLKQTPHSLVTFCGKATAYAFFFCPGIADTLIRLWKLPYDTLRRVAAELGLNVQNQVSLGRDQRSDFPSVLSSLEFATPKILMNQLRGSFKPDPSLVAIDWLGPWLARWCGRDTDLFFVFVKHYHILAEEFIRPGSSFLEKACSPGFLPIHSQLHSILHNTLHRQSAHGAQPSSAAMNLDDIISGVDATAATLPLPPSSKVTRLMSENRLVILLREFLSEHQSVYHDAQHTFGEALSIVTTTAIKRISLFDYNASFILCDYIEEALVIYVRFHSMNPTGRSYIDWVFGLELFRKMLSSGNTLSDIRLFSLVFGTWSTIIADPARKKVLCIDWLLSEEVFQQFFLHWCPMVRAYYMRLICWRLCRHNGQGSELDSDIFLLVVRRLRMVWSHYLFLKQEAERDGKLLPSSAPCLPAPDRRLLIIRNDSIVPASNLVRHGGKLPQITQSQPLQYRKQSSIACDSLASSSNVPGPKRKWSLLGKLVPSTGIVGNPDLRDPTNGSELDAQPLNVAHLRRPGPSPHATSLSPPSANSSSSSSASISSGSSGSFQSFSFKFSLEWNAQSLEQKLFFSRNRTLTLPQLPSLAGAWLSSQNLDVRDDVPSAKPEGIYVAASKYAGRALSEWSLVVTEYNNFVDRRKAEGVPTLAALEVPTLGVEGFRR